MGNKRKRMFQGHTSVLFSELLSCFNTIGVVLCRAGPEVSGARAKLESEAPNTSIKKIKEICKMIATVLIIYFETT
jgi:hypothetical protein